MSAHDRPRRSEGEPPKHRDWIDKRPRREIDPERMEEADAKPRRDELSPPDQDEIDKRPRRETPERRTDEVGDDEDRGEDR
jgi:hypothetical protein